MNSTMNNAHRFLLAALCAAALTAHAADWENDGWRPVDVASTRTTAQVRAELDGFKKGPNPWAADYNPLAQFKSTRTRTEVQAEYLAEREAVAAMNREDGGSAYLAEHQVAHRASQLAGQPTNPQ
jgi:hypothetical protein